MLAVATDHPRLGALTVGLALAFAVGGCGQTAQPVDHTTPAILACPPGRSVAAEGDHRSYPLGGPELPVPGTRVVRCFASVRRAIAAGFPVAAPPGSVAIGGVYLVPTDAITLRQCRRAADKLGFAVPCPRLSPTTSSSPPSTPPNCQDGNQDGPCVSGGGFEFSEMGFVAPRGYVGFAPGDGHFVLLAVPAREERDGGVRDLFCLGQRPLGLRVIEESRRRSSCARPATRRQATTCCCTGSTEASSSGSAPSPQRDQQRSA